VIRKGQSDTPRLGFLVVQITSSSSDSYENYLIFSIFFPRCIIYDSTSYGQGKSYACTSYVNVSGRTLADI